jgi:SAM-dependent methyltransferase
MLARVVDAEDLRREWDAFSAEWINRSETRADAAREGLLDDWMLDVVGDVGDLDVIDLGCGEGRFCRMLAARGARTLGIDLQPTFVEYAEEKASATEHYIVGDMQSLVDVPDSFFDVAVSYLSLVDVPDQAAAIRAAFRVLAPGGRFVVCNLSPMNTASVDDVIWWRDDDGNKLHFVLDDYATEGPRRIAFPSGYVLTNFHRMLSTTVNDFLDAGFVLARLHEPLPTEAQLARVPDHEDLFRVPLFTIYHLRKPLLLQG